MRTSEEIKVELADIKSNPDLTDGTEDILLGWAEALEWVLSEYKEEDTNYLNELVSSAEKLVELTGGKQND
jgi:hypothetical protein